jgi:hypothetical protein
VWQPDSDPDQTILREPREKLRKIGVHCCDVSVLVAPGDANSGYVPLSGQRAPGVQIKTPLPQELQIDGLQSFTTIKTADILGEGRNIQVDLKPKNGIKPFYNGLNHLVWQDGEPIDPFVFNMAVEPPAPVNLESDKDDPQTAVGNEIQALKIPPALMFQREVYNQNLSLLEMTPLQRLLTSRGPCGYNLDLSRVPSWVLSDTERQTLQDVGGFYATRASVLREELSTTILPVSAPGAPAAPLTAAPLSAAAEQRYTDKVVSLAERLARISVPDGSVKFLNFVLHYGHTLSGPMMIGEGLDELLSGVAGKIGLQLAIPGTGARSRPNSRWVIKYACGSLDVDALSNLVYGELFLPVTIQQVTGPIVFSKQWKFPASVFEAVIAFAARFDIPFWTPPGNPSPKYEFNGLSRTVQFQDVTISESVEPEHTAQPGCYSYSISGFAGLTSSLCSIACTQDDTGTTLEWKVSLEMSDPGSAFVALAYLTSTAEQMSQALTEHFRPNF